MQSTARALFTKLVKQENYLFIHALLEQSANLYRPLLLWTDDESQPNLGSVLITAIDWKRYRFQITLLHQNVLATTRLYLICPQERKILRLDDGVSLENGTYEFGVPEIAWAYESGAIATLPSVPSKPIQEETVESVVLPFRRASQRRHERQLVTNGMKVAIDPLASFRLVDLSANGLAFMSYHADRFCLNQTLMIVQIGQEKRVQKARIRHITAHAENPQKKIIGVEFASKGRR